MHNSFLLKNPSTEALCLILGIHMLLGVFTVAYLMAQRFTCVAKMASDAFSKL